MMMSEYMNGWLQIDRGTDRGTWKEALPSSEYAQGVKWWELYHSAVLVMMQGYKVPQIERIPTSLKSCIQEIQQVGMASEQIWWNPFLLHITQLIVTMWLIMAS